MPTAAELNVKINSTLDESGFDRAEQRVQGLGSRLGTALGTAGGFLLANAVQAVASNIGQLASEGLNFEAQMANVNSIAQLSAQELQQLSDQVLQLAQNPGITQGPAELAAGLYNIASSGFAGADGLQVLEASAIAATAGLTSSETAATAITAALNAYGLEADSARSVSDILFQTVNEGVITFEQLANNLGNTLAPAASLGVGLEELGAAYARLTLSGVQASQAETQIAALMRSALNPTEALTSAVQAQGYASAAAAIEAEGMSGFLQILTDASGGSQEELFNLLGTTEAMNAALLLGGENLDEYIESVTRMGEASEGAGATQTALNKQMQSASFRIAKMRQQLQVAATMFMGFLAPGISAAAEGLTRFISGGLIPFVDVIGTALRGGFEFRDAVDALPEPLQRTAGALGSVFEAVGDVIRAFDERGLAGAIQTLTSGGELDQIATAFGAIADEAWNALVAGFNSIPWGTVWDTASSLITAAASAGIDLTKWTLNVGIPNVVTWLGETASGIWDWLKGKLGLSGGTVGDGTGGPESDRQPMSLGSWVLDVAMPAITGWLSDAAGDVWPALKQAAGWVGQQLFRFGAWELTVAVPTIAGWLKTASGDPWNALKQAAGNWSREQLYRFGDWTLEVGAPQLGGWLNTNKADIWEGMKTLAGIPGQIQGAISGWVLTVAAPALGGWIADIGGNLWGWLKGKMGLGGGEAFPDPNTGEMVSGGDSLGISSLISGAIASGLQAANDAVVDVLNAFGDDVEGWKTEIVDAIKTVADIIIPDIKLPTPTFDTGGILRAVDALVKFIGDQVDRISNALDELKFWEREANREAFTPVQGLLEGETPRQRGNWPDTWTNQPSNQPGTLANGETVTQLPRVGSGSTAGAPPPIVIPPPDMGQFISAMASIPQIVGHRMSEALSAASTYSTAIGSVVGSQIGAMVGNVTGLMTGFTNAVGQGMSNALSAASVYSGAIVSAVSAAFGQLPAIAASTTGQIPGIIAGNLAAAAATAFSSGAAIGQGLAAGMNSTLGQVQAAAASLAAAAAQAAAARLQIASPSKVFTRMGEQVGDGFVIGIQSRYGAAGSAGAGLAGATIPTTAAAAYGRRGASGNTVVINALKSDELVRLIEKAERGGQFAIDFPQLVRQGAY